MNGTVLSIEDALKAVQKSKDECVTAIRSLAYAAIRKEGKYMLSIDKEGELFVAEDTEGGSREIVHNNDLCIYIADSGNVKGMSPEMCNPEFWEAVYRSVVSNLNASLPFEDKYEPYSLFKGDSELGLFAEIELAKREREKDKLRLYTPDKIALKNSIENIFGRAGMKNIAKDEYRDNAFSFDYVFNGEKAVFEGDDSRDFWALYLIYNTTFAVWGLDDPAGVEFDFSLNWRGDDNG